MTERRDTAGYLEELAATLASHGSSLAALRMAELEQKVSPYLAWPGAPSAQAGSGGSLAGVDTAYAPTVAMGAAGLFITDGAIQVTNAGSTVIIDGTSNMFKIAATGTQTVAFPVADASNTVEVTLTALGTYTVPPAMLWMSYFSSGAPRYGSHFVLPNYSGYSIGGSMTCKCQLDGSSYLKVQLTALSGTSDLSAYSAYSRYHVLKEAGI
jgi:hypothetical protein